MTSTYSFIYKTTNLVNGKIYVGQHRTSDLNDGYIGSGRVLWKAVEKYGRENFKTEILEHCAVEELNEREMYWIEELNSTTDGNGYNLTYGGGNHGVFTELALQNISEGTKKSMTPEVRKRIAESVKKRINEDGFLSSRTEKLRQALASEDVRLKMSISGKGKLKTEEHRRKISEGHRKIVWTGSMRAESSERSKGYKHTEEAKKKISFVAKTRKRKPHDEETVRKIRDAHKAMSITCPHCGKVGHPAPMKRHHFDNCKIAVLYGV